MYLLHGPFRNFFKFRNLRFLSLIYVLLLIPFLIFGPSLFMEISKKSKSFSQNIKMSERRDNFSFQEYSLSDIRCSEPYITIFDGGRLGNHVCHLMSILIFKIDFGLRIAISIKMFKRLTFLFEDVPAFVLPHPCFEHSNDSKFTTDFVKMYEIFSGNGYMGISKRISITPRQNTHKYKNYIPTYTCNINYLIKYRKHFQSTLKFREDLKKKAQFILDEALKEKNFSRDQGPLISVHVRRKDYLKFAKDQKIYYPSLYYYYKAIEFYSQNCQSSIFVVISDDIKWAKEKIYGPRVIYPGNGNINRPELDFTILSLCDHHVAGIGTFAMTSSLLGRGSAVIFKYRKIKGNKSPKETLPVLNRPMNCSSSSEVIII
ncbi:UNVERIFIED_CONTAM: hypothetical protein RMT77_003020 [Armadillidium vulgare]